MSEPYHSKTSELRFDMAEGEFTHFGDWCSFEAYLHRLRLQDRALAEMAEIIHDIDLKDKKGSCELVRPRDRETVRPKHIFSLYSRRIISKLPPDQRYRREYQLAALADHALNKLTQALRQAWPKISHRVRAASERLNVAMMTEGRLSR